jgi:hypothetical protein
MGSYSELLRLLPGSLHLGWCLLLSLQTRMTIQSQGTYNWRHQRQIYTRKRVLIFTSQSCSTLFTIFSTTGWASWRYSLNCSSEHSAATPYANASSRASGQKDFTKLRAWLTHAMGASVRKLRTFCGALRSRSSKGHSSASPSSCGSTMSTSFWAAP